MQLSEKECQAFSRTLLEWASTISRPMPWKSEKDPYKIWLSEIILQQTRVEQGLPYYEAFVKAFPDVSSLAAAPEDKVMKLWEGLGYYSRARNLHSTAKYIVAHWSGTMPRDYKDIRALKGVGDYTAAAIASFAYDMPYAVVDGNVMRVLSRYCGIHTPIDSTEGKRLFATLAAAFLDKSFPAQYNQAIMDFGAIQCTPRNPACAECALATQCVAYHTDTVQALPKKSKAKEKTHLYMWYILVNDGDNVLIRKRIEKNIWKNLYEFPVMMMHDAQSFESSNIEELVTKQLFSGEKNKFEICSISKVYKQELTHRKISALFIEIKIKHLYVDLLENYTSVKRVNMKINYAFPKIITWYLEK